MGRRRKEKEKEKEKGRRVRKKIKYEIGKWRMKGFGGLL
jgi:hypothetical protein